MGTRVRSNPIKCFGILESTREMIVITKVERDIPPREFSRRMPPPREGVTKAQEAAMVAGSVFGTPLADPKNYDEQCVSICPKAKDSSEQ